jgi:hypothetical protein
MLHEVRVSGCASFNQEFQIFQKFLLLSLPFQEREQHCRIGLMTCQHEHSLKNSYVKNLLPGVNFYRLSFLMYECRHEA